MFFTRCAYLVSFLLRHRTVIKTDFSVTWKRERRDNRAVGAALLTRVNPSARLTFKIRHSISYEYYANRRGRSRRRIFPSFFVISAGRVTLDSEKR